MGFNLTGVAMPSPYHEGGRKVIPMGFNLTGVAMPSPYHEGGRKGTPLLYTIGCIPMNSVSFTILYCG
jgi:hypothetical protein